MFKYAILLVWGMLWGFHHSLFVSIYMYSDVPTPFIIDPSAYSDSSTYNLDNSGFMDNFTIR